MRLFHWHRDPNWQERGLFRYWQCKCGARRTGRATLNLMGPVDPGWPDVVDSHGRLVWVSPWVPEPPEGWPS